MKNRIFKESKMKKAGLLIAAAVLIVPSIASAGAPTLIPVQGVLTDSSDQPVNGVKSIKFSLYTVELGSSPVWTETQNVAVTDGFFSAYLGDDTALSLLLFKDNSNLWLGVQVDSGQEQAPRTYLGTGPYTAFAEYCGNVPAHMHPFEDITGTLPNSRFSAYSNLISEGYLDNSSGIDLLTRDQCDARYSSVSHNHAGTYAPASHNHGFGDLPGTVARTDQNNLFSVTQSMPGASFTASTGTAPFSVASETKVANLNADLLDGLSATAFAQASHTHGYVDLPTTIAKTDQSNTFTSSQTFGSAVTFNSTLTVSGATGSLNVAASSAATFNNRPSFAASSGAPFTVVSTARVTNLNADQAGNADTVDGMHASDFVAVKAPNLMQIALRRWYEANTGRAVFWAGSGPVSVEFDGANIWVGNRDSSKVTKFRAGDGALLGSYAAGSGAYGVVFDGRCIWVTNYGFDKVTKILASDGSSVGEYAVGDEPYGAVFDGSSVWVVNKASNNVTKLNASDGSLVGTYNVGASPRYAAFDGANIWVTNWADDTVTKLRASDGSFVGTYPVGGAPSGLAFDGIYIWVANYDDNKVSKLKASDGSVEAAYATGRGPMGVVFDGYNIWVSNYNDATVTKLRASNGSLVGTYFSGSGPSGMAFDGAGIWVSNFGSDYVTRL